MGQIKLNKTIIIFLILTCQSQIALSIREPRSPFRETQNVDLILKSIADLLSTISSIKNAESSSFSHFVYSLLTQAIYFLICLLYVITSLKSKAFFINKMVSVSLC